MIVDDRKKKDIIRNKNKDKIQFKKKKLMKYIL